MNNRLILVRGVPGSGKTTFCTKMFPNIFHLENDMYHYRNGVYKFDKNNLPLAISWCQDLTEEAIGNNMDVVVSNTFTRKTFIDSYKRIAEENGAEFIVYRMMGTFNNIHEVPVSVLESMKTHFDDYEGEIKVYPQPDGAYMINGVRVA